MRKMSHLKPQNGPTHWLFSQGAIMQVKAAVVYSPLSSSELCHGVEGDGRVPMGITAWWLLVTGGDHLKQRKRGMRLLMNPLGSNNLGLKNREGRRDVRQKS